MKDTKTWSVLRSFLAAIMVFVMAFSMSTFVFADEADAGAASGDATATDTGSTDKADTNGVSTPVETVKPEGTNNESTVSVVGFYRDGRYVDYYNKYAADDVVMPEVLIEATQLTSSTAAHEIKDTYEGRNQVLVTTGNGELTYTINVTKTGLYALNLNYFPLLGDGNGKDYEIGVKIDGKYPHNDASRFVLKRNWTDEVAENNFDDIGNELYSKQVESAKWLNKDVRDPDGVFDDAVKFYLTAGVHTITLAINTGVLALDSLRLYNDGAEMSYADYIAVNDAKGAADATAEYTLEAEDFLDKSESLIQPAYDRSDPKVTPYSISKTRLNVIGGENWNTTGQTVNWVIDIPEDGYYTLGIRYRQSYVEDSTSYRRLFIDGVVPFEEANTIGFPFGTGYQYKVIGGEDESGKPIDYKFYLTAGKHELSMEVVIGDMAAISREAEDLVYQLNYIYRKIIIITGTTPDTYRDYELDKKISDLEEMFKSVYEKLLVIKEQVIAVNGNLGSASIITTLEMQVADFIKMPYAIPDRLSTFKDNISTLSSWMLALRNLPVQFDKMIFTGAGGKATRQTANFWEGLSHEVNAFISSFVDDYTSVGTKSASGRTLTAWVGTGRDQATVLKTLTTNYFTPETDISVNVGLVPLSILQKAIVAGRGPDIALHVSRTEPMNLGYRNAVVDLTQFSDFEEVASRFSKFALTPYTLSTNDENGNKIKKIFALPETQDFKLMFYRTDIFAELGIKAPNTWDELDDILPYIQANNMTVGLDPNASGETFYTLILQSGHTPYKEDGTGTNFTEQFAIDAFERWTRYYLQYDLPTDYSWYSRFRNGEMPLVIQGYSSITYLQESAPELNGLWDVAPMPGILDKETGVINRTDQSSGMSGCMIIERTIEKAKNPEQKMQDAWTFLKWWTSKDIAADYGNRVEMAIGSVARYSTANLEAFEKIKWSSAEAAIIREQRQWTRETPELVGGYYVSRNVINAFRNVVNNKANPREKLFYYNNEINDEIWRKRSEYHLSVPEEARD